MMENSNVVFHDFDYVKKVFNTDNQENKNTTLLKQKAKPDSVEINGQKKTLETSKEDNGKKKGSLKKKLAIAAGIATAAALSFAAIRKGKVQIRKVVPFSHEPLLKDFPTVADLDKMVDLAAANQKAVKLDYGFGENVKTAADIKKALTDIYPTNSHWFSDSLCQKAEQNDALRYLLRIASGKNFSVFSKDTKEPLSAIYLSQFEKLPQNTDKKDIEAMLNFACKRFKDNRVLGSWQFRGLFSTLKQDPKETARFMAFCDNINTKFKMTSWSGIDSLDIISNNPDVNYKDIEKFFKVLKKGSVSRKYSGDISFAGFNNVFANKDFNVKFFTRLYTSLNNKAIEHVDLAALKEIMTDADLKPLVSIKKLNSLPEEMIAKFNGSKDAITYLRFEEFLGKKNINELSQAEKRKLMNNLIKNNTNSFGTSSEVFPLIPKDQKQYCGLLNKLAKSIGISTKELTAQEKQFFEASLSRLENSIKNVDFDNVSINLKISRDEFIQKVNKKIEKLDEHEQRKVMDYFGFEIEKGKLKGYPINLNNGEKLAEIADEKTKKVIEELRPLVVDFSEHNPITVSGASKSFEQDLNDILKGFPELRTMIGKVQHKTHAYTLDKHTLKVLQGVVSNPKYAALSAEDKKILEISALLHDITKTEGVRDLIHPTESAFDAFYIIQKLNLSEEKQLKIYELIKSHNWLDRLNNPKNTADDIQRIAQDIAFDSRHTNTFELAKILCEADMKAVKKDASFFEHHKKTLDEMSSIVDKYVRRIHETQIVLPQTVIPKASQLNGAVEKSADGIKNKVIYINSANDNLAQYGFAQGTTKDNFRALVHALDQEEQMQKFNTFSVIDTEALLSTSYIDTKSYRVFRKQGFILDVNPNDIHAGYCSDFGTGYAKTIELLKSDYLFSGARKPKGLKDDMWRSDRTRYRDYISGLVKNKMGINNDEYVKLIEKIQGCKSLTDIEKVDKNFAKTLKETFEEMESKKRSGGRQYNEMLVTRPKIQAVFAYDKSYEKIPEFLRKYAQDNDLPIIIFG